MVFTSKQVSATTRANTMLDRSYHRALDAHTGATATRDFHIGVGPSGKGYIEGRYRMERTTSRGVDTTKTTGSRYGGRQQKSGASSRSLSSFNLATWSTRESDYNMYRERSHGGLMQREEVRVPDGRRSRGEFFFISLLAHRDGD
jgi:hypothetical protein